jgi:hypothetical protein
VTPEERKRIYLHMYRVDRKPRITISRQANGTNYYAYRLGGYMGGACSFRRICEAADCTRKRYALELDAMMGRKQ